MKSFLFGEINKHSFSDPKPLDQSRPSAAHIWPLLAHYYWHITSYLQSSEFQQTLGKHLTEISIKM